jgi:predicted alpha/beta superfamily hydrolase
MRQPAIAATFILLAFANTGSSEPIQRAIPSAVLGEDRPFIVHLPQSYAQRTDQRYPVLYVLDGTSQDGHTAATAAELARTGVMPEVIVVGIPNTRGNRPRDQTPPILPLDVEDPKSPAGSGDVFLNFIKSELIPAIDREYRTGPHRTFVGHSRGALLVAYSLIVEPDLFDARFVFSAPMWRRDHILVSKLEEFVVSHPTLKTFLYLSAGERENANIVGAHERTVAMLKQHASKGIRWHAHRTPGADHQNNAQLSTPAALTALFAANAVCCGK